jgi:acyl-coenzyme A synthetase/AMP-(fatty) acid ligase
MAIDGWPHTKVPHQVEFTAEIPKNTTSKILKRVLREQSARAAARA